MPRFYFDVRDGDKLDLDDEGVEFASTHEARVEASRALAEMIKDAMPNGWHKAMALRSVEAEDSLFSRCRLRLRLSHLEIR
jgi:hypothetical protein